MQDFGDFDINRLMVEWRDTAKNLKIMKERESAMRAEIVRRQFPNPKDGTQRVPLGNGYSLKAVYSPNYKIDKDQEKVDAAEAIMHSAGNEGSFIAARLIKYKPEMSVSEYKSLIKSADDGNGTARAILTALQSILTIEKGSTELTIEEPKA